MCFNGGKELQVRTAPEMRTVCGLAAHLPRFLGFEDTQKPQVEFVC